MQISRRIFLRYIICLSLFSVCAKAGAPDILLAQIYQSGLDVTQYLVSEKYDGVRAVWDGRQLISRQGNVIHAPVWFVKDFPKMPLDGELWLARGQFDALSGAVRKDTPIDADWEKISYLIFELPDATGNFEARAKQIIDIVSKAKVSHLKAVKQFKVKDEAELKRELQKVVKNGGEGLMLHRADAPYITGRSDVLLKLKLLLDAEAKVVGYTKGRGKYQGKVGALIVETPAGIRFKLGTGLSDAQREQPPKVGSMVTYTYRDITKMGKPKFASFLRERKD